MKAISKPPRRGGFWPYSVDSTFKTRHSVAVFLFGSEMLAEYIVN